MGLRLVDVPSSWSGSVPQRVELTSQATLEVPVLVGLDSAHRHGEVWSFLLEAWLVDEPETLVRIPMGVHFPTVPQPAGHHSVLYIHSRPQESPVQGLAWTGRAWFNAAPVDPDPNATDEPVGTSSIGSGTGTQSVQWHLNLEPALRMGLDFDVHGQGRMTIPFQVGAPAQDARLRAQLGYSGPVPAAAAAMDGCSADRITLANEQTEPEAVNRGQVVTFELEFQVPACADRIPWTGPARLPLSLWYEYTGAPATLLVEDGLDPRLIVDDARIEMPLEEFRDDIDARFEAVGTLQIRPVGSSERVVNAGRTALLDFEVSNRGEQPQTILVPAAEGHNADWVEVHAPERIELGAGEIRMVPVAVAAPLEAQPGELVDAVVRVQAADNPAVVALSRLRVLVVEEDVADEAHLAPVVEVRVESPGLGAMGVLMATTLGLGAWGRRRGPRGA